MKPSEINRRWLEFRGNLRVGDIILVHTRKGWVEDLIRRRSGSYWNHVVIVLETWDHLSFGGPLIVDIEVGDVAVHRLKKYTDHPDMYDWGVLRLNGLMTDDDRARLINFILNHINTPYDTARVLGYLIEPLASKILSEKTHAKAVALFVNKNKFICSSFVYKAFHQFRNVLATTEPDESAYREIDVLETRTPGDIAADEIFEWQFNRMR